MTPISYENGHKPHPVTNVSLSTDWNKRPWQTQNEVERTVMICWKWNRPKGLNHNVFDDDDEVLTLNFLESKRKDKIFSRE